MADSKLSNDKKLVLFAKEIEELERRTTAMEDLEAIHELNALYGYYCDRAVMGDETAWDELMNRWTVDCTGRWTGLGDFKGRKAVKDFYINFGRYTGTFSMHMKMNGVVKVDGDKATGTWYLNGPYTMMKSGKAAWVAGKYEEEYVKVNGVWMWNFLFGDLRYFTPYDKGWVESPWGATEE